ncbi:MAG: insulinase family protein [Lachnospiraceae bacterium]|nr:insulinase family protein [Lachnospiraceae bacterium]
MLFSEKVLTKYILEETTPLPDKNATGYRLRHQKTGARIALIENDDANKVFYIAFRTPPKDDTGVAHIIEHSVLCGSAEFPVKDPFVELAKGSLNTFLNAMTYPDKTVYPVASVNEQDFKNLMHVYLDAVFFPEIYRNENIFLQEGWHYEFNEKDELLINGVVYNEMKGAVSSQDDVLETTNFASLFPHTTYGKESGGNPKAIPTLSYEEFLDFHRQYYHPSNSYIYLYGNLDIEERLLYLDEAYLSRFEYLFVDSAIEEEKGFLSRVEKEAQFATLPGEDAGATFCMNYVFPKGMDAKTDLAMKILDYALTGAEGAPVKEAFQEAGVGAEVLSSFEDGILQPTESIVCKYCGTDQKDRFANTLEECLRKMTEEGIASEDLLASLSSYEFRYREADFGAYPKGLFYGLQMLDTWLYEDDGAFDRMNIGAYFSELRQEILNTDRDGRHFGLFTELMNTYFLKNTHASLVSLYPEEGLTAREEEAFAAKNAAYLSTLSEDERKEIRQKQDALKAWQDMPDPEENLKTIPMLKRSDLDKNAKKYVNEEGEIAWIPVLKHRIFTNHILYLDFLFDLKTLSEEEERILPVFKTIFSALDTASYSYAALDRRIHIATGGISCACIAYTDSKENRRVQKRFEVSMKVLPENLQEGIALLKEVLFTTKYEDEKRIRNILEEERSAMKATLSAAGHQTASLRAQSYFSESAVFAEKVSGIEAYRTLDAILNEEEGVKKILPVLKSLSLHLFSRENLMVDIIAQDEDIPAVETEIPALCESLFPKAEAAAPPAFRKELKQEAFTTAGQVQYACYAGNYKEAGFSYSGALRVLRVILGYDYLWNRVRVMGGAYGCMSAFGREGTAVLVSYRDPHLLQTLQVYRDVVQYLKEYRADERSMTGSIIGAISVLDTPMTPLMYGRFCLSGYMTDYSEEDMQKERDEVLNITPEDIRALAPMMEAVLKDPALCVVGTESKITEHKELFKNIAPLIS